MTNRYELPWPPSVNHYYKKGRGGRLYISKEGQDYRWQTKARLLRAPMLEGRLKVFVEAYPPDRRRHDLDNLGKCLFDSCQAAGLYEDDSQIDDLHIVRRGVYPKGKIIIELSTIEIVSND